MSWVGLVVLLKVRDGEGHIQVPDVLNRHHLVELLRLRQITDNFTTVRVTERVEMIAFPAKASFRTDSELFLLERMLWEFWDGHVLVLHLPKQLYHHGRELVQGLCGGTSTQGVQANEISEDGDNRKGERDMNPHLVPTHTVPSGWRNNKRNGTEGAPGGRRCPGSRAGSQGSVYCLKDGVTFASFQTLDDGVTWRDTGKQRSPKSWGDYDGG